MSHQPIFYDLGALDTILRDLVRLLAAMIAGALIGFEREERQHFAGLRTHMLVSLGSALFIIAPQEFGVSSDGIARVMQGLLAGIGFLGAGTILKLQDIREVKGLTTAATLWVTAGIGVSLGLGLLWPSVIAIALTWVVLLLMRRVETWIDRLVPGSPHGDHGDSPHRREN
jgi:putative Mg2+ transporter-C (MgtC) family protein